MLECPLTNVFTKVDKDFYVKNNRNFNSYKLSYKLAFKPFCPFA